MDNIITKKKKFKKCGVYMMKRKNSKKKYIGQSIDFNTRVNAYKNLHCEKQPKLFNALKKYGFADFKIDFYPYPEYMLNWIEATMIRQHNTIKEGYNCTTGGENARHSDETKAKMSKIHSGENNAMYGKKHSPESLKKMSDALKGEKAPNFGKTLSDETKEKISKAKMGWQPSKESIQKRLDKMVGWKHTEASKAKIAESQTGEKNHNYGKKASAKTREKMSQAAAGNKRALGLKHSDETRKKCREASRKYWAMRKAKKELVSF